MGIYTRPLREALQVEGCHSDTSKIDMESIGSRSEGEGKEMSLTYM